MPKSKYPQQLDSSAEIPAVRDNVLEAGSEVINSLRSAIFKIEQTLGINPQGSTGQTVAERLNRSLDSSGNLKSDALDRTNLLTGPILDNDVSTVAAIKESKLKLDFPTTLLQDEISILNTEINEILTQLSEIATTLSVHINPNVLDRHPALSISVENISTEYLDDSLKESESTDLQSFCESVINGHINYSGENISNSNNSHTSNQIYFDNDNVSSTIESSNLQEAIEELVSAGLNSQIKHQNLFHNNGILNISKIVSPTDTDFGNILSESFKISFFKNSGQSNGLTEIVLEEPLDLGDFNLEKSDILTISDESDISELYVGNYQIESFTESSNQLISLYIYGTLFGDSTSLSLGKITKNINKESNRVSLLAGIREETNLTSARTIQVCNPNSVRVISNKIRPLEITTINRFIGISIDDGDVITVDLYDGNSGRQNLDSIVAKINEQASDSALNIFAYRVDFQNGSELAIACNLPDNESESHTLKITRQTDDGIDAIGFSDIEDQVIKAEYGTTYYIQGEEFQGLKLKLNSSTLSFISSTRKVNSSASGIDFLELGIKKYDLIIISNAANSDDNGTYVIDSILSDELTLNSEQLPSGFSGSSQDGTTFQIYENIVSLEDLIFSEVSETFGAVLGDVFMTSNRDLFFDKRIEYSVPLLGSDSLMSIVDFEGEIGDKQFLLTIEGGDEMVSMFIDDGPSIEVRGSNNYVWVSSGAKNAKFKLSIPSVNNLNSKITSLGTDLTVNFFGFDGVNPDQNLIIARLAFNNFNGRITGGEDAGRIISKLESGNIGINEISNSAKYILAERSNAELRANGVVLGLEITNFELSNDLYSFNLGSGVCYINGKRIEVSKYTNFITHIDATEADKIFVAIDQNGIIQVERCTGDCISSFENSEFCIIGTLEYDNVNLYYIDLRLFIDKLDLKLLNSITVSPENGLGHFNTIGKAIKYARRFSEIFPNAGTPTIHLKSGTFSTTVDVDSSSMTFADWNAQSTSTKLTQLYDILFEEGHIIDFPVNIIGEGNSTEIRLRHQYTFSDATYDFRGYLAIPGDGFTSFTSPINKFDDGFVNFKDFKMNNSRLVFVDFNITDGVHDFMTGITVDNIIFNMKNFTSNPIDDDMGPRCISLNESNDVTTNKGNITINNCNFLVEDSDTNTAIIRLPNAARTKNVIISNNRIIGNGDTSIVRLLSSDIWNFTTADNGANIIIFGNIPGSNFNTESASDNPDMILGVSGWGDRISRSLKVGGTLEAGGDLTVSGSGTFDDEVTGSLFNYNQELTRTKYVFFENIVTSALGDLSAGTSMSTLSVNGRTWRTVEFDDNTSDYMIIRLEVLPGETLDEVNIIFATEDPTDSTFAGYNLKITTENAYGDSTTVRSYSTMGTVTSGLGTSNEAAAQGVSNLGFTGAANKHYLAHFKRSATTGYDQHILYVQYTTNLETVQALGGLS